MMIRTLLFVALSTMGCLSAHAQQGAPGSAPPNSPAARASDMKQPTSPPLSAQDRNFATKAAQAGLAEVAAGKLAASNGGSDAVKKFGEQMVQDHGKANDQLKQIAQAK